MFAERKSAAEQKAVVYVEHDKGDNYFRKKQDFPGKSTKKPPDFSEGGCRHYGSFSICCRMAAATSSVNSYIRRSAMREYAPKT